MFAMLLEDRLQRPSIDVDAFTKHT